MTHAARQKKYRQLRKRNRRGSINLAKFAHQLYLMEMAWVLKVMYKPKA